MKKIFCILILAAAVFATTGKIVWRDLNLRERPTTASRVITQFHEGKYFKILGSEGGWIHANANGYIGYFKREGIEYVNILGKYVIRNPDGATFMWGPSRRYPVLASGPEYRNAVIEVVWKDGEYFFGQYNGSGVYFHEKDLDGPKTDEEISDIMAQRQAMNIVPPDQDIVRQPIPMAEDGHKPRRVRTYDGTKRRVIPQISLFYANGGIDGIPKDDTQDGYQQTIWALGMHSGIRISFGERRFWGMTIRLKGSWTPNEYITPIRGTDYRSMEQYIFFSLNTGFEFDMGEYMTAGFGGGYGGIYDIITYGIDGEKTYSLSEEVYFGPTGYVELAGGLRHFRVFAGADYYYWMSDKSRFYVIPYAGSDVGRAIPDGNEYHRHMIRGFAGLQVLF